MAYVIRKLKATARTWKPQWEVWSPKRKAKDIPLSQYSLHGFSPSMSYDEACQRRDELNAQASLRRHQANKVAISERLGQEELAQVAYLGEALVREFERDILYEGVARKDKMESHWRAARRILCELRIDVSEWEARKRAFYSLFTREAISPAYLQKLVRIINLWGKFITRKRGIFFEPLPYPRGYDKERIADAYFDSSDGGYESLPLTPAMLEAKRGSLEEKHLNWLYLSLWFGLRPEEVDSLRSSERFRIEKHEGKQVLFVYQTKLTGIARDKRWKYIPCLQPEQVKALSVIRSAKFSRPLSKTVQAHFGEGVLLYGGRKGFEHLMGQLGYALEYISTWLGHQSIERTWRNYKNKQKVRLPG